MKEAYTKVGQQKQNIYTLAVQGRLQGRLPKRTKSGDQCDKILKTGTETYTKDGGHQGGHQITGPPKWTTKFRT